MEASIYRLRLRDILTLCVLGLLSMGFIMVQSASSKVTGNPQWAFTDAGRKHAIFVAIAIVTFLVVGQIDYRRLFAKSSKLHPVLVLMATAFITCGLVLVPHIGKEVNGARRWLGFGPIQLQPSELAKWAAVVFLSWFLTSKPTFVQKLPGFLLTLVPVAALCLLVVIQDFGTAALIGLCTLTVLVSGPTKIWHLLLIIPPGVAAALAFIMHKAYRVKRMTAFMDPWADARGVGYHMVQSLLSFSTGGISGRGLGNGIQKLGYLPEDTTDFIFAVICEEMGLFGAMLTAVLYMGILFVVWQVIRQKRDAFGRLLALGIGTMIGLQAAINMAVATVSVPTKGLSLPLISAGGSGLVITSAALGLLYSITRFEHAEEEPLEPELPLMKKAKPLIASKLAAA
jgi:cell division protein FtsW